MKMDIFSEIKSNLERKGNIIDDMEVLIAATALSHNLILVTNDVSHFSRVEDLRIENWKNAVEKFPDDGPWREKVVRK